MENPDPKEQHSSLGKIGPMTCSIIDSCFNKIAMPETRKYLTANFIIPLCNDIRNSYINHIRIVKVWMFLVIALLIIILYFNYKQYSEKIGI
jgi:hypothetical protein